MKIMQIIPAFRMAGAETMCENLCNALNKLGHEVIAVSLYSEKTIITERLSCNGIRIEYLDKKPGFDLGLYGRLFKLIKKEKPDAIHTHIYCTKYVFPVIAFFKKIKVVHTVHSVAQKESFGIGKKINKLFFKINRVVPVALSNEVQKSISEVYNIPIDKIPVVTNGVDLSKCIPKENYEIGEEFRILHIGRFMEVKNHELLINVFAELCKKYPFIRLKLVGEGELMPKMKGLVEELAVSDKVEFMGLQENVYPILHEADMFILPSQYEGIPMTLIEAMGTGLPIVASRVGGIPDMLVDGEEAVLAEPNERNFVDSIEKMIINPSAMKKIGILAKNRSEDFSANKMGKKYQAIY